MKKSISSVSVSLAEEESLGSIAKYLTVFLVAGQHDLGPAEGGVPVYKLLINDELRRCMVSAMINTVDSIECMIFCDYDHGDDTVAFYAARYRFDGNDLTWSFDQQAWVVEYPEREGPHSVNFFGDVVTF